jgi:protein-disulfide isomerase
MHIFSRSLGLVAAALSILVSDIALAQSNDEIGALQAEVQAIRQGQEQIQKDLAEIKKLLQQGAKAAPPGQKPFEPTDFEIGTAPVIGDAGAQVTLVEFSDYQCPFCRRHATTVMPALVKDYVDTGKVKIVMREYPIESIHSRALVASQAALCANEQGKYWEMHDIMFDNQKQLASDDLKAYALSLGLETGTFDACLDEGKYEAQIRVYQAEGQKLGVTGTPSFVVGLTDPKDPDKVRLTTFIHGAKQLPAFQQAIDELLTSAE